jgi:hypothetical protein
MTKEKEISLEEVLASIRSRMAYHEQQMEYANSFSRSNYRARLAWSGHKKCYDGLQATREAIFAGDPCNRSIARMFGQGARLQEGFEYVAAAIVEREYQRFGGVLVVEIT